MSWSAIYLFNTRRAVAASPAQALRASHRSMVQRESPDGLSGLPLRPESLPVALAGQPRHVPGPLAPVELVEIQECFSPTFVRLIARDPGRVNRLELYVERDDVASIRWFVKVLRLWLAWRHNAIILRVLRQG